MNAELLERIVQSNERENFDTRTRVTMYLTGETLNRLAEDHGDEPLKDDRGLALVPQFLYCVTPQGIFEVED